MASSLLAESRGSISEITAQRRYSRAYDAPPILQQTGKGPMINLEGETKGGSAVVNSDGNVLQSETSAFGVLCAKCGLVMLSILGVVSSLLGKASLLVVSQTLGVVLLLLAMFVVYSGIFYSWGKFYKYSMGFSVRKIWTVFGVCVCSDVLSRVFNSFTNASSVLTTLQFDLVQVVVQAILLFMLFSSIIHPDGLNGMFSGLTSSFVGLALLLNLITSCLLSQIIPASFLSQLTYTSVLMGLTVSLIGVRFPSLSYGAAYMTLTQQQPLLRSSYVARKSARNSVVRRTSTGSLSSNVSSSGQNRRNSMASVSSSFASTLPNVSPVCVCVCVGVCTIVL